MSLSNAGKIACQKCGQELPSDSEFCQFCGAKIETSDIALVKSVPQEIIAEPTSAFQTEQKAKSTKAPVIIGVLSTVIVALITVLIIVLVGNDASKDKGVLNVSSTPTYEDSYSSVEWLSEHRFVYYDDFSKYILLFQLSDKNQKAISASGSVNVRIVNDKEVTVYNNTVEFTKSNFEYWTYESNELYLASIYIKPSDIKVGETEFGTVYFTVSGDNYSFEEMSTSAFDLPIISNTKPQSQNKSDTNNTNKYTCLNSYCDNEVVKSGAYCFEHKCQNGECRYEKEPNLKYCSICLCGTSGCSNAQIANGMYCSKHKCENGDCGSEKEPNAKYCSICLCGAVGCSNVQIQNGYYCNDHMCSEKNCQYQKAAEEKYCSYHACDICGELRTSGSLYCSEHD